MRLLFENQSTINSNINLSGVSMHSGNITNVILKPANVNYGIRFNDVILSPLNIFGTQGMTRLGNVNQIEHICSCLYALGIDNINITVDTNEMPILDGCSRIFLDKITDKPRYFNNKPRNLLSKKIFTC